MRYLLTLPSLLALVAGPAAAQAPRPGDVQKLNVISIAMQVGSTEKDTKKVTYTPPPGWYIRSHSVHCTLKHGPSSYSVTTVPANWNWSSEEKINESYRQLLEVAAKAQDAKLQAKLLYEREEALSQFRKASYSHHALVVDATAQGQGLFMGGGALQLTVTADLVYVGPGAVEKKAAPDKNEPRASGESRRSLKVDFSADPR